MFYYLEPIYIALSLFIVIAVLIFIPWLIYIYRRFGYFPFSTTIIVFSFIFYFMAALFLTMLPMPDTRHNCTDVTITQPYSLKPFQFIEDIKRETRTEWTNPSTYAYLLKERAFLQAFFNFLLLMPLGVYLRYYFGTRRAWWKALPLIASVTLFYEVTQATGIYGFFDCPYRVFDVDDLILNTAGGLLGFFLAPIILALFPSRAEVHEKAEQLLARDEVRNMAVLLAMAIDLAFIRMFVELISSISGYTDAWSRFIVHTLMLILWLAILPAMGKGATFGTRILRFRYTGERLFIGLVKRTLAVWLVFALQFTSSILSEIQLETGSSENFTRLMNLLEFVGSSLLVLILFLHVIIVLLSKEKRRFYFDAYAKLWATRRRKDVSIVKNRD